MTATVSGSTRTGPLDIDPSAQQQRAILDAQRAAFLAEGPPSLEVRLDRIDRFMASVLEYAEEISAALTADFGNRPRLGNFLSDFYTVIPEVTMIRNELADWMKDVEVPGSAEAGTPSFIQSKPKGVVGIIGPWNFPVLLVIHPAIEALAAGNRLMIKFSDIPARTADVFAKAIATRMGPDEVEVIRGGVATAQAFSELPFDHLIFTGSPGVGALVASAAGKNLVPVTLELGGKNPVVVTAEADIADAAERISGVRLLNGGQICLCPDYVFIPSSKVDEFVSEYQASVRGRFPTYVDNPAVVSIINERNFDRVNGLIEDARDKGANIVTIAPEGEESMLPHREGRRIPPTIVLDATPDMTITSEEIFGPVVVVYPYDDLADVIDYVNSAPSPLAAYWFGPDNADFRTFIERTTSGGVTRNDLITHWGVVGAPSGGIGRSGTGAYSGKIGFDTFSHKRTITASESPQSIATMLLPLSGEEGADAIGAYLAQAYADIRSRLGES
jgi:coniferyl-aldehyde dehydrogenase